MGRWLGGILATVLGALLGFALLLVAFLVALQTSAAFREWVRGFNKRRLNPAVLGFAGRAGSPYAVMRHVGRRSGRPYVTPVRVRQTPDGFIVPLPYGREVDWCRNVLAAGSALITWQGMEYPVAEPEVITMAAAAARVPLARWRTWLWTGLLARSALGTFPCLWVRRLSVAPESVGAPTAARAGA